MKNLISALIEFQKVVPLIPKDSVNPFFNSKYAELSTVIDTCMSHLNYSGLAIMQKQLVVDGRNQLVTTLCHDSGEYVDSCILLPEINDPQKLTAAITYLRRSQYLCILGLVADTDDDGNYVSNNKKADPNISEKQPSVEEEKEKLKKQIYAISMKNNIAQPTFDTMAQAKLWVANMNSKKA